MPDQIKLFDSKKLEQLVDSKKTFPEKIYVSALCYADMGWPVVPVQPKGKQLPSRTAVKRRQMSRLTYREATTDFEVVEKWFHPDHGLFRGYNIGLACGLEISAIDMDIKEKEGIDGVSEWLSFAQIHDDPNAQEYHVPAQETPGGGMHIIYKHIEGFRTRTSIFPGVDSRGSNREGRCGSHIVAYPSIREMPDKSEKQYKWISGGVPLQPSEKVIQAIQSSIVHKTDGDEYTRVSTDRGNEEMSFDDYYENPEPEEIVKALTFIEDQATDYTTWVRIGMALHSFMDGTDGFDIWHEWSKTADTYRNQNDCYSHWRSFSNEDTGNINIGTLFWNARKSGYRKPDESSSHLSDLRRDRNGKLLNNSAYNLHLFLTSPEFIQEFGAYACFDEFTQKTTLGHSSETVSDELCSNVATWMSDGWLFERSATAVNERLHAIGKNDAYNSLQNYLSLLPIWDGTERLEHIAREVLFASSDFQAMAFRKWMINGISQGMDERPDFCHMMILIGKQGIGKSRFFKALSPDPEWVVDNMTLNLGRGHQAKEEEQKIMGKWIAEVAELAGFFTSGDQDLKSFITQRGTTIRMPYARNAEFVQRRCLWAGTTNEREIIRDSTGSRRYVFIDCGDNNIDVEWVEVNRDQIWAEAKQYFRMGEKMYLDQEEMDLQNAENARYRQKDAWEDTIQDWAVGKTFFKSDDVFNYALKITDKDRWSQASRIRIKKVLESVGFKFDFKYIQKKNNRCYHNPDKSFESKPAILWVPNDTEEF